MRIAVCDDMAEYAEQLTKYIKGWAEKRQIPVQVLQFTSGEEVLFELEAAGDFAIVFLDAVLEGMDGLETAVRVRKRNPLISIVFVSRHERYLKEIGRVYPAQFIGKPISEQEVYVAMEKARGEYERFFQTFTFRYNRVTCNITLREILYFVSEGRKIRIVLEKGGERVFYEKLDEVEGRIAAYNRDFLRIHKSFLVNERYIRQFFPDRVEMRNGDVLPISREKRREIRKFCMNFL